MIVLDSSAAIELLAGTEKGEKIRQVLENEVAASTPFTIYEVLPGAKNQAIANEFIKTLHILPFDSDAAFKSIEIESGLRKRGTPVGKIDVFIASICIVHDIPVLTTDKDFQRIHDLKVVCV